MNYIIMKLDKTKIGFFNIFNLDNEDKLYFIPILIYDIEKQLVENNLDCNKFTIDEDDTEIKCLLDKYKKVKALNTTGMNIKEIYSIFNKYEYYDKNSITHLSRIDDKYYVKIGSYLEINTLREIDTLILFDTYCMINKIIKMCEENNE